MTLRELSKYYRLHERLERNRQMLSSLYAAAGLGAQALTGMPHATGVSDKVSDLAIEIEDLKERITRLEAKCEREKKRLEQYIGEIRNDQTRMVFRLRFIHCMTWKEAAETIGGRNTAGGVKKICYRYIAAEEANLKSAGRK